MTDSYELIFEFEIGNVLKKSIRDEFFRSLEDDFTSRGISEVSIKDFHYILNKEFGKAKIFAITFRIRGTIKNIIEACNRIIDKIYGNKLMRVEIYMKSRGSFYRYVKKPLEKGYLKVVNNSDVLPEISGKIVLCDLFEDK